MSAPALSYVLTTRNKRPMLREVMTRLIEHRAPDEEILVVDAASSDGTPEYLEELQARGEIDWYTSEPDHGEAHGFNKAILRSGGALIKLITDDDAFYWPGIRSCRDFMATHPTVDAMAGNTCTTFIDDTSKTVYFDYFQRAFERWAENGKPFDCGGLGLMIRRSSLPLLGLLNTALVVVDQEYTLRMSTAGNVAWYTGMIARRIASADSNYDRNPDRCAEEMRRVWKCYLGDARNPRTLADPGPSLARRIARSVLRRNPPAETRAPLASVSETSDPGAIFASCDAWLSDWNARNAPQILARDPK
jgi:glycosyltransferase involved in cell wall biosynthesis